MSSEKIRFEQMIRSVSDLPKPSPGFRKRVLRTARRAEKDRVRSRIRWTLCLCAAGFMLVVGMYSYPPRQQATLPSPPYTYEVPRTDSATEADWHYVEKLKEDRKVQSGFIRGSY